jgi:hypothetical protein
MIRLTSLLIVLTLASLPAASAICLAWCDMHPSGAGDCHHADGALAVNPEGSCAALVAAPFLRQDVRVGTDVVPGPPVIARFAAPDVADADAPVRSDRRFPGSPPRAPFVLRL